MTVSPSMPAKSSGLLVCTGRLRASATAAIIASYVRAWGLRPLRLTTLPNARASRVEGQRIEVRLGLLQGSLPVDALLLRYGHERTHRHSHSDGSSTTSMSARKACVSTAGIDRHRATSVLAVIRGRGGGLSCPPGLLHGSGQRLATLDMPTAPIGWPVRLAYQGGDARAPSSTPTVTLEDLRFFRVPIKLQISH